MPILLLTDQADEPEAVGNGVSSDWRRAGDESRGHSSYSELALRMRSLNG